MVPGVLHPHTDGYAILAVILFTAVFYARVFLVRK